jgi:hypothetical protein
LNEHARSPTAERINREINVLRVRITTDEGIEEAAPRRKKKTTADG